VWKGIFAAVLLLAVLLLLGSSNGHPGAYPEVAALAKTHLNLAGYREYFEILAKKKGAVYAFDVLKRATLAPNVDIHLLGHYIGYVLYDQEGIRGIQDCTNDFRNACSHSVVISAFLEHGASALKDIAAACAVAPGGRGAFTMCYHGLGHGILAYLNYDFSKVPAMCRQASEFGASATPPLNGAVNRFINAEYECIGGAVMEMTAGDHDPVAWEKQVPIYTPDSDPLMPCDSSYVPDGAKQICYTYITYRMFVAAHVDQGNPDPMLFPKAFSYCNAIPSSDTKDRAACYGGFGKEFVGMVNARDIRDVGAMAPESVAQVRAWCALAGNVEGEAACDSTTLSSLFWGGENDPRASLIFCGLDADPHSRDACYSHLVDEALYFLGGTPAIQGVCEGVPEPRRSYCLDNGMPHV
jgi:hypothetical protein